MDLAVHLKQHGQLLAFLCSSGSHRSAERKSFWKNVLLAMWPGQGDPWDGRHIWSTQGKGALVGGLLEAAPKHTTGRFQNRRGLGSRTGVQAAGNTCLSSGTKTSGMVLLQWFFLSTRPSTDGSTSPAGAGEGSGFLFHQDRTGRWGERQMRCWREER